MIGLGNELFSVQTLRPLESESQCISYGGTNLCLTAFCEFAGENSPQTLKEKITDDCDCHSQEADLIIRMKDCLFPVHRAIISEYSLILGKMIHNDAYENQVFDDEDEDLPCQCINLENSQPADITLLLNFIYHPKKKISGKYL